MEVISGADPVKHYIFLSVEIPPHTETIEHTKWLTLAHRLERLAKTIEGIVQLDEGVWLLPRDQGMIFALECIAVATKVWFLSTE
jgi:hypothetical protein